MTDDRRDLRPWLRRLWNPATGQYLHQSGTGETQGTAYAWRGLRSQAETLRRRAEAAGEEWPYEIAALERIEA
jgi:hypothetical protein